MSSMCVVANDQAILYLAVFLWVVSTIASSEPMKIVFCCTAGWQWEGAWEVDKSGNTDKDGWAYGLNFPLLPFPPTSVHTIHIRSQRALHTVFNARLSESARLALVGGHSRSLGSLSLLQVHTLKM